MNEKNSETIFICIAITSILIWSGCLEREIESKVDKRGDGPSAGYPSLVIDRNGTFHLVWSESVWHVEIWRAERKILYSNSVDGRIWNVPVKLVDGDCPLFLQDKNGRYIITATTPKEDSIYMDWITMVSSNLVDWNKISNNTPYRGGGATFTQDINGRFWVVRQGSWGEYSPEIPHRTVEVQYSDDLLNWSETKEIARFNGFVTSLLIHSDLNNTLRIFYSCYSQAWMAKSVDGINWNVSKFMCECVQSVIQLPNGTYYAAGILGGVEKPKGIFFLVSQDGKKWNWIPSHIKIDYDSSMVSWEKHLSLAYDMNNTLWLAFDDDVLSGGGQVASDIWLTSSKDGINWEEPIRITHNEKKMEPKKKVNFLGNLDLLTTTAVIVFVAVIYSMYKKKFKRIRT